MINYDLLDQEEGPFALRLAEWIKYNLNPKNLLDVGCGPGTYVRAARHFGIDAIGIDRDDRIIGKDHLYRESVIETERVSDLVICLEVMEHIPTELTEAAIGGLARTISSAATVGQGGDGHINCRVRDDWLRLLEYQGLTECLYIRKEILDYITQGYHMGWFVNNLIVMVKPS
jgi:SAM-dependent methyltransferase